MSLVTEYLDKTDGPSPAGRNVDVPPMLRNNRADKGHRGRFVPAALVVCIAAAISGYAFFTFFSPGSDTSKQVQATVTPPAAVPLLAAEPAAPRPRLNAQIAKSSTPKPAPLARTQPEKTGKIEPASMVRAQVQHDTAGTAPVQPERISNIPVKEKTAPRAPVATLAKPAATVATIEKRPKVTPKKSVESLKPATASLSRPKPLPVFAVQTGQNPQVQERAEPPVAVDVKPKAVKATPQHYFSLGVTAQKNRQYSQAMDYYRKALALDPSHSGALLNFATIHMNRGNLTRAVQILEKLQRTSADNPEVVFNLGTLYIRQKKYKKARQLLEGFMALDKSHPGILFNLAYLYQLENKPAKALEYYNQVLTLVPGHTKALLAAASVCEKQHQIEIALGYYNRALILVDRQGPKSLNVKIKNRIRLLHQIGADLNRRTGTNS